MDVLSGSTLAKALKTCDEHDGARIGIACAGAVTTKTFIDSIWAEITSGRMPGWEMGREVNGYNAQIRKRGKVDYSTIEIFHADSDEDIRGRSYHQVLYEKYLIDELVMELGWCERLSFDTDGPNGQEALDEFLNSFKIV